MLTTAMTLMGNIVKEPELRPTQNGYVTNFTVAVNKRRRDPNTRQWVNAGTTFIRCTAWNELAQNIANSLHKGTSVIVSGEYEQSEYTDRATGEKRTAYALNVDAIGVDLHYCTVQVNPNRRDQAGYQSGYANGASWGEPQF